jgi:hypothetical protein
MKLRQHINKAVFGLVAAALQLLPGQGKADEAANECAEEAAAVMAQYNECASTNNAADCLDCLQQCGFVSAVQTETDCLGGSQSLMVGTGCYETFCNLLSGGSFGLEGGGSSGATN